MGNAGFAARRHIDESLVTGITLSSGKAIVSGVNPVGDGALRPLFRPPVIKAGSREA